MPPLTGGAFFFPESLYGNAAYSRGIGAEPDDR